VAVAVAEGVHNRRPWAVISIITYRRVDKMADTAASARNTRVETAEAVLLRMTIIREVLAAPAMAEEEDIQDRLTITTSEQLEHRDKITDFIVRLANLRSE